MLDLVASINGVLWGPVLLILLCGTGIYYTFRLKFIQVRKFGEAWYAELENVAEELEKQHII